MEQLNESIKTSVHSYNKAYDLYKEIEDLWKNIDNIEDYQYMDALDKIEDLQKHINKIDLIDINQYLDNLGRSEEIENVKHNIDIFKEVTSRIYKEFLGTSYYNELLDAVPKYITTLKNKFPLKYPDDKESLSKRFTQKITKPSNIELYKSNIEAIIKGSMSIPYFSRIFDTLVSGKKPAQANDNLKKKLKYETPPEMFSPEAKKEWEKSKKESKDKLASVKKEKAKNANLTTEKPKEYSKGERQYIKLPSGKEIEYDFEGKSKDGITTYFKDDKEVYSYMGESFISFSKFKKYNIWQK